MTRPAWLAAGLLCFAACDDEVVGFADAAGSSTGGEISSNSSTSTIGPDASTSSSDDTSTAGSSSGDLENGLPDYVAYGFEAGVAVSFEDGEVWIDAPELADMAVREGLARGEERIVLVGGDRSAVTVDGLAWEVQPFEVPGYARDVAYGSGGFASVGLDHLGWSDDGQTWSDSRGGELSFDLVAVAYGNDRFVAVGVDQIATSDDGQDWTLTPVVGEKLRSIVFGDGRFVAVGELGRIVETQDGLVVLRDESSGLTGLGHIRFCEDSFVIGGSARYWRSPDAAAWTELESIGEGAFACSGTSWVVPKEQGLFWAAQLRGFDAVHTAESVFYEVEFTGLASL